jgi:hypothetical protein
MGVGLFAWALYIVDIVAVGNLLVQMGFGFVIVLAIMEWSLGSIP